MTQTQWPQVRTVGVDGFLVSFGDRLSEAANRAALAFRSALEDAQMDGIEETSTSLASAYLRFDAQSRDHIEIEAALRDLVKERNWFAAELPAGRRLWRIPTVFGTELAPQLGEAAALAGLTVSEAVKSFSSTRVRVQTIGFAPGQPYLGELAPEWDIPRQTDLTPKVPLGAVTVAIRQIVLFSVSAPTGWRHVGQTAFQAFRPKSATPFALTPGDEVMFSAIGVEAFAELVKSGPDGGATWEPIP